MTSVWIVARQPAFRAGLSAMVGGHDIRVLGESAELGEPPLVDVVLLAGEELLSELDGLSEHGFGVVLLTDDESGAARLPDLGLRGWAILPPDVSAERLAAAVTAAGQGLAALSPELALSLSNRAPVRVGAAPEALQEPLTARELEVLQLVSQGLSNKLIARQLHISEHTVKFHVSSTYGKLGAANRTEAVSQAARRGLISL